MITSNVRSPKGAKYCYQRVRMSVRLSANISLKRGFQASNIRCRLPVVVAQLWRFVEIKTLSDENLKTCLKRNCVVYI